MKVPAHKSPPPCPICRKPAAPATKPFCSARCADIDLGRWLGERYVIPGPEDEEMPLPPPGREDERSR